MRKRPSICLLSCLLLTGPVPPAWAAAPDENALLKQAREALAAGNQEKALQLADNRPLLPKLKMPVLVLTGEKDTTVLPWLKADLLRLTPITLHVDMPGLGHAPYLQAPNIYNSLIDAFLVKP